MLYSDITRKLLASYPVRRASWARGVYIFLDLEHAVKPGPADRLDGARLGLYTPNGCFPYSFHSVDRKATDWELHHGPTARPATA